MSNDVIDKRTTVGCALWKLGFRDVGDVDAFMRELAQKVRIVDRLIEADYVTIYDDKHWALNLEKMEEHS